MIVMLLTAQCPPIAGSPQGRKDLIIVSLVCDLSAEMWGTQRPGVSRPWRGPESLCRGTDLQGGRCQISEAFQMQARSVNFLLYYYYYD